LFTLQNFSEEPKAFKSILTSPSALGGPVWNYPSSLHTPVLRVNVRQQSLVRKPKLFKVVPFVRSNHGIYRKW
jgi:hypothetical protein